MGTQPSQEVLRASLPSSTLPLSNSLEAPAHQAQFNHFEIHRHFDNFLHETSATDPKQIEEAFRLRYQVYCLDRGFESVDDCPEGMEYDSYDDYALHCLLRARGSTRALGTVRLVLPPATPTWFTGLPLAAYASEENIETIMRLPAASTAEVSRFAIARSAREILRTAQGTPQRQHLGDKLLPYMSLGLIRGLVRLSKQHGVTHWCLAAEPCLLRRLRSFGLHFRNAGPLVDHRGMRQVCYANLEELLARAQAEQPEFWDIITVGGFLTSSALSSNAA